MTTALGSAREALASAERRLAAAGCDTPRLDAEVLLAYALGVERAALFLGLGEPAPPEFETLVARRESREPVAYITGRRAFRRLWLDVDRRVLIPRPETELLVEIGLELPRGARVHDAGTGSGAVALALKDERPDLVVSGSDISPQAIEVARANAARLGLDVTFEVAPNLPTAVCDLSTSNLPYVREDEWAGLAPEIRLYEPRGALVAGADGLDAIRGLVSQAPPGTRLALEHAPAQAAAVRALLRDASTRTDLAGRERVTLGTVP
jgi:release factor glutamine methyltransferase